MKTSAAKPRITRMHSRLALITLAAAILVAVLFGVVLTSGAQAYSYNNEEAKFVKLINDYRVANGLKALLVSDLISQACYRHNHDMAGYKFFSHYSQKSDWFAYNALPWDRMTLSGYNFYTEKGENIAAGQQTAEEVFAAWKASAGHNANMLGAAFKVIGVSRYELAGSPYTFYWTTDFGGYVDSTAHTVSVTTAPATTRYEQNSSGVNYSGGWNTSTSSNDSGGSYSYVNGTGSMTVTFNGTYLAYVTKKGPAYGYVKITLDNGTPVNVDLYNGGMLYQQKVWNTGTIANGTHTVKIEWTGIRRSAATSCNIGVDAFDISGSLVSVATRYQQSEAKAIWTGTWATVSNSASSGGSYTQSNTAGASATINFKGTSLAWIATKGATMGKAYVSIDGGAAKLVDLASSSSAYNQRVYTTGTLSNTTHTVKITAYSGNAATQYINIDGFDISGTPVAPVVSTAYMRYEQTDSHFVWAGTWTSVSNSAASGGSYKQASASGASVTVKFTGTSLVWVAELGPKMGKASVSVDSGAAQIVNLNQATAAYGVKIWNTGDLTFGVHTVKITWYSGNAAGLGISADAFSILGTLN